MEFELSGVSLSQGKVKLAQVGRDFELKYMTEKMGLKPGKFIFCSS